MSDKIKTTGLKLLNDSVFDPKQGKDAFSHNIYAKVLTQILTPSAGNDPGISVALFGKWGQGKSSVVQMMEDAFNERSAAPEESVKVIWFNAWKTRGDHVRRQLLLSIIKGIDSPKYEQIGRFIQPGNPLIIRPYSVQEEANKQTRWWLMARDEKLDPFICGAIGIGIISLLAFVLIFFADLNPKRDWAGFSIAALLPLFAACMAVVYRWFCNRKDQLLTSAEPVSDSQRLKYPDQFQRVFEEELAEYRERDGVPIIVVVDDLDRCEASTVVEALAAIRQLGGKPLFEKDIAECRFLVPCDESQVLSALKDDGHHDGYEEEDLLRKFFDVIIRMDAFLPDDMVAYARTVLNKFDGVDEADIALIQELVGSVAPRNPRQVKKLVNAYLISKEKTTSMQESKALRAKDKLDHFDKSMLAVIALQETVPTAFEKLVESPLSEFERLRKVIGNPIEQTDSDLKAAAIIRALDPVSHHTFRLLTRKGLPETLAPLDNGPDIYDAIQSGKEAVFAAEIEKVSDLSCVAAWLKEHRQSLHSVARFRNALSCLIEPTSLPDSLQDVVADYVKKFPRTGEALKGFHRLLDLAEKAKGLDGCKRKIHNTIISNLNELPIEDVLQSEELRAVLIFSADLTDSARGSFARKINPLIGTDDPGIAMKQLAALKASMSEDYSGAIPSLALTITRECTWDIYPEDGAEAFSGLHSTLIAAFAGNDEETLHEIIDLLFGDLGPLSSPIDLASPTQVGAREAMLTLKKISERLSADGIQILFDHLRPWLPPQTTLVNFMAVCNALGTRLFCLSEEQIDDIAIILANRACTDEETEWLFDLTKQSEHSTDETKPNYNRFCKKVFERFAEQHLASTSVPAIAQSLLTGMSESSWNVADEAEAVLAEAIKSKVTNEATWNMWKTALWSLCRNNSSVVKQATAIRIKENIIPDVFIPFAVEELFNKKLTNLMETTLKEFFYTIPAALSCEYFASLFDDETVEGRDRVIRMIIEDLRIHQSQLDEPRIAFLIEHSSGTPPEVISQLEEHIRIKYLQTGDIATFSTGLTHTHKLGAPSDATKEVIRNVAQEQASTIPSESQSLIETILGEQIFDREES